MAVDEALLAHARRTGEVVVRTYRWSRPTLSLGRNQTAVGLYAPERLAEAGVDVVRRPTGGRAVLHWRELTYAVAAPTGALAPAGAPLRASYARINRLLLHALRALGVGAREAEPVGRAPLPDGAPCFETPTGGELVVPAGDAALNAGSPGDRSARKLVGSAQWQEAGALLQHGSILLDDDQSRLPALAARPVPVPPPPATLRLVLGDLAPPEVMAERLAAALDAAVRALEHPHPAPFAGDATFAADVARLAEHHADPAWVWRR